MFQHNLSPGQALQKAGALVPALQLGAQGGEKCKINSVAPGIEG